MSAVHHDKSAHFYGIITSNLKQIHQRNEHLGAPVSSLSFYFGPWPEEEDMSHTAVCLPRVFNRLKLSFGVIMNESLNSVPL